MKKYIKLISLAMAVLMLVLAVPFTAFARSLTDTTFNTSVINENNLLFSLANFASTPTTGKAAEKDITLGDPKMGAVTVATDGDYLKVNNKARTWYSYVRGTGLPLTGDEEYTITYTATLPENTLDKTAQTGYEWTMFGFAFNVKPTVAKDKAGDHSIVLWKSINSGDPNVLKLWNKNATAHTSSNSIGAKVTNEDDFCSEHKYILSINKKEIKFFIDEKYIGTLGGDALDYITDGELSIGMRIHADTSYVTTSEENPYTLCSMSDINVYKGAYGDETVVKNYKDGDALLKLKTPLNVTLSDKNYNGSEFSDLVVTQNKNMNVWKADGTPIGSSATPGDDDTIYTKGDAFTSTNYWFEAGATTNLPLNEDSKYTIEFYMKNHQAANKNLNVGFIFDIDGYQSDTQKGIYYFGEEDSISTLKKEKLAGYKLVGSESTKISCADLWTKYADADGYTRFSIEIDGTYVTVFVGGQKMGTFDFAEGYTATTLSLAVRGHVLDNSKLNFSDAIVSVKDVTVYAGHVESACRINFEKDGAVIGSVKKNPGEQLVAGDFPTIEDVEEGKFVKWFYKGTNIIVNAPHTLTHDMTLEARIVGNGTEVAGMQCSALVDGKQSVRFLATLNSLQGTEVGFEVNAVYKDTDGTVRVREAWNVTSTAVYTYIKAKSPSGTVSDVTAEELGGTYLVALAVNGVPNYEQVDFYVKAYVVVDGEKLYSGDDTRFTLRSGEAAMSAPALERP